QRQTCYNLGTLPAPAAGTIPVAADPGRPPPLPHENSPPGVFVLLFRLVPSVMFATDFNRSSLSCPCERRGTCPIRPAVAEESRHGSVAARLGEYGDQVVIATAAIVEPLTTLPLVGGGVGVPPDAEHERGRGAQSAADHRPRRAADALDRGGPSRSTAPGGL